MRRAALTALADVLDVDDLPADVTDDGPAADEEVGLDTDANVNVLDVSSCDAAGLAGLGEELPRSRGVDGIGLGDTKTINKI